MSRCLTCPKGHRREATSEARAAESAPGHLIRRYTIGLVTILATFWSGRIAWADPNDNGDVTQLRGAHVGVDGPGLLDFFRKRSLNEADRKQLDVSIRHFGDNSYRVREQSTQDVIGMGKATLRFLRQALQNPDLEIVRRATLCIEEIDRDQGSALPSAALRPARSSGSCRRTDACGACIDGNSHPDVIDICCSPRTQELPTSPHMPRSVQGSVGRDRAPIVLDPGQTEKERLATTCIFQWANPAIGIAGLSKSMPRR